MMPDQILYASISTASSFEPSLSEILHCARRNNPALGISGMLIIADDICLQLIEGEPDYLDALFEEICRDSRHERIVVLERRTVGVCDLPCWAMGYAGAGPDEAELIGMAREAHSGVSAPAGITDLMIGVARRMQIAALAGKSPPQAGGHASF